MALPWPVLQSLADHAAAVAALPAEGALPVRTAIVDLKTDAPPKGTVAEGYPAYVEQVRECGRILVKLGLAKASAVRCGLLFTGAGGMRWL